MATKYSVTWQMDIWAKTPEQAAKQARKYQRSRHSIANCFEVFDEEGNKTVVDLEALKEAAQ